MEMELIEYGRKHEVDFSADVMIGRLALELLCPIVLSESYPLRVRANMKNKEILQWLYTGNQPRIDF